MYQSVVDSFVAFSKPLEGCTNSPYLDVVGLLTVGIGCLIDPAETALSLPWVIGDELAEPSVTLAQLHALKAQQGLKEYRYDDPRVLAATTIRLTDAGVLELAMKRLSSGEPLMRKAFASWDSWPADAQLFACSMGWAIGFGWSTIFGNCARLLAGEAPQFGLAATGSPTAKPSDASAPCDIKTAGNPGIVPRNAQNRLLLTNAQVVMDRDLDRSVLHWPKSPLTDGTVAP